MLDRNDNSPVLVNASYKGVISEAAPIGSLVLLNDTLPMLIKALDADSGSNGLLQYEIVEFLQSRMFHVVSNTGKCITTVNAPEHRWCISVRVADNIKNTLVFKIIYCHNFKEFCIFS